MFDKTRVFDDPNATYYLCGPMTGYPDFNYPLFDSAANWLRARGVDVINPAENLGGDTSLPKAVYMRIDIQNVLDTGGLLVLPGWETSQGAVVEMAVAFATDKPVYLMSKCGPDCKKWHIMKITKAEAYERAMARQNLDKEPEPKPEPPKVTRGSDMLHEAASIIQGGRRQDYGHPLDDFTRTADAINSMFFNEWVNKGGLDAEDIPKLMVMVKLSRETNREKYDNRLDGAGYFGVLQEIIAERNARDEEDAKVIADLEG